ncbi:MAG: hypothetical protein V4702_01405 [Patescibacteria group bacterium]
MVSHEADSGQPFGPNQVQLIPITQPEEADFVLSRQSLMSFSGQPPKIFSDEDLRGQLERNIKSVYWVLDPKYQNREASQQWRFEIDGEGSVDVFNLTTETEFTQEHADIFTATLAKFKRHFPFATDQLETVLVDDTLPPSFYGDPRNFPTHGYAVSSQRLMQLTPLGLGFHPYRRSQMDIPTFQATFCHELAHIAGLDSKLSGEWFSAGYRWYSSPTKGIEIVADIPNKPEECVSDYAQLKGQEDICESVVAYLLQPELLRAKSPRKYNILGSIDQYDKTEPVSVVGQEQPSVKMPTLEAVRFFIDESIR